MKITTSLLLTAAAVLCTSFVVNGEASNGNVKKAAFQYAAKNGDVGADMLQKAVETALSLQNTPLENVIWTPWLPTAIGGDDTVASNTHLSSLVDRIITSNKLDQDAGQYSKLYAQFVREVVAISRTDTRSNQKLLSKDMKEYQTADKELDKVKKNLYKQWKANSQAQSRPFAEWVQEQTEYIMASRATTAASIDVAQITTSNMDIGGDLLLKAQRALEAPMTRESLYNMKVYAGANSTQVAYKQSWSIMGAQVLEQMKSCDACGLIVETSFSNEETSSSRTHAGFSVSAGIPFQLPLGLELTAGVGAKHVVEKFDMEGKSMNVTVQFGGVKPVTITPGAWFEENWGLITALNMYTNVGKIVRRAVSENPKLRRLTEKEIKLQQILKKYFGPNGPLSKRVDKLIIGYKPNVSFRTDSMSNHTKATTTSLSANLNLLGFYEGNAVHDNKKKTMEGQEKNGGMDLVDGTGAFYILGLQYTTFDASCNGKSTSLLCLPTPKIAPRRANARLKRTDSAKDLNNAEQ